MDTWKYSHTQERYNLNYCALSADSANCWIEIIYDRCSYLNSFNSLPVILSVPISYCYSLQGLRPTDLLFPLTYVSINPALYPSYNLSFSGGWNKFQNPFQHKCSDWNTSQHFIPRVWKDLFASGKSMKTEQEITCRPTSVMSSFVW